jgi:hypothetical protein
MSNIAEDWAAEKLQRNDAGTVRLFAVFIAEHREQELAPADIDRRCVASQRQVKWRAAPAA